VEVRQRVSRKPRLERTPGVPSIVVGLSLHEEGPQLFRRGKRCRGKRVSSHEMRECRARVRDCSGDHITRNVLRRARAEHNLGEDAPDDLVAVEQLALADTRRVSDPALLPGLARVGVALLRRLVANVERIRRVDERLIKILGSDKLARMARLLSLLRMDTAAGP
jgi:hypothetical protein